MAKLYVCLNQCLFVDTHCLTDGWLWESMHKQLISEILNVPLLLKCVIKSLDLNKCSFKRVSNKYKSNVR